jgi:hypothetical protein
MVPIQSLLADILANEDIVESMRERAMCIRKYDDKSQADDEIIKAIDYVMDSYQAVGDLVSEIDRKHSNYTKSSIEKIQYLMTADQTIKGKLTEILRTYASMGEDKRDQLLEVMDNNIHAGRQEFFDGRSLYHKSVRHRRVNREPLSVNLADDFIESAESYLTKQINSGYPVSKIRAFVDDLFINGRNEIKSENIPITCDSDFILLILALIRQGENGMPHSVELQSGRVERNGYIIPNMVIRKRGVQNYVE